MSGHEFIREFYSKPQAGGGMGVFAGTRRQLGGSFLSGLARFALPILKFLAPKVASVASGVASDVIGGQKSLGESIKSRGLQEIERTVKGRTGGSRKRGVKKGAGPINKRKKVYQADNL